MIRIGWEIQCLPYVGFFYQQNCFRNKKTLSKLTDICNLLCKTTFDKENPPFDLLCLDVYNIWQCIYVFKLLKTGD